MTLTNEHLAILGLAVVFLFILWRKGYVKWPTFAQPPSVSVAPPVSHGVPLTTAQLGELMALAAQQEAQRDLAQAFAKKAAADLKASYMNPFSTPDASPPSGG